MIAFFNKIIYLNNQLNFSNCKSLLVVKKYYKISNNNPTNTSSIVSKFRAFCQPLRDKAVGSCLNCDFCD